MIFIQKDYNYARIAEEDLEDINGTATDRDFAVRVAHGFGVNQKDITHI